MEQIVTEQVVTSSSVNKKKRRYLRRIAILATFGAVLFGYDTGVINGSLSYMTRKDQLNLSPTMEGLVTSSLLLGAAIGGILWGYLADRYGRKIILRVLAIIFCIATVGCSLSANADILIAFRVLLGLSVGGVSGIVPLYLGEISPSSIRGSLVCQDQMMIVTGQLLAYVMNGILGNTFDYPGIWRYMIALATIPAIVLWIGSYIIPETPRWLASQGKDKEALNVLRSTRDDKEADQDIDFIKENIQKEQTMGRASFKDFGTPWLRRILIIGVLIAIMQQFAGINVMMYYGTTLLETAGFGIQTALIANIGNGVLSVLGTGVYLFFLANRIRRRPAWIGGLCVTTASLALIAVMSRVAAHLSIFPYIVIICTMIFVFIFQMTLGPVCWLLLAEIFPLKVRALGAGISVFAMWITNFLVGLFFPILLASVGMSNTFWIFVGLGVICIAVSAVITPETSGKTLEEVESYFRGAEVKAEMKAEA